MNAASRIYLFSINPTHNPSSQGENGICFGKFKVSRAIRLAVLGACQYVGSTDPTVRPIRKALDVRGGVTVSSAVQYVGSTGPTVLPARKEALALTCAPLDNHEIAFGCVRLALHLFS